MATLTAEDMRHLEALQQSINFNAEYASRANDSHTASFYQRRVEAARKEIQAVYDLRLGPVEADTAHLSDEELLAALLA